MKIAAILAPLGIIVLWAAAILGYVLNIVKLIPLLDGGFTTMFIGRVVGIFAAPLGSVLGFF
jgi:hypothetical protein